MTELSAEHLLERYAAGERTFAGIDLAEGSVLAGATLEGCIFRDGVFSDIDARRANLKGTVFTNMNLKCTDFRLADLTDAVFDGVLIESAAFKGAKVDGATFQRMTWHGREIERFDPQQWDWEDSPP